MTLTTEERAIYRTRLTQAEDAYHQLRLGQSAKVFVDQNGERVEYQAARADQLRAYVIELKVLLGLPIGVSGPLRPRMLR